MKNILLKYKKALVTVCAVIVLAALCVVLVNAYVICSTRNKILSLSEKAQSKDYDCILVLGAGIRSDGSPSNMLEDRLKRAYELYKDGASAKILVSGDNGSVHYNETGAMKKYLVETLGVPQEDVVCDYAGFSTYDSIYRSKEIFCAQKIVVVTQKYHLYRALYIADSLGIDASGAMCDYREYAFQIRRDVREIAARCKDFLSGIFKPNPKFLGEKIPIN